MKNYVRGLLVFAFSYVLAFSIKAQEIHTLPAKAFKEAMENSEEYQLIDVRTPEEWSSGIVEGAKTMNWFDEHFVENVDRLDKSDPVFVYCASGRRSLQAAQKMSDLGFKEVYNLEGGITSWKSHDLPIK